jgi:Glycosyltransferase family 92
MHRLYLFLLFSISSLIAQEKYALVICAVFKNESFFLKQWIDFHQLMGVDHFYLYNNESTDDSLEILQPYVEQGLVDLIDWPAETHDMKDYLTMLQMPVFNHALSVVKDTAHWAAFIDPDEFLCPMQHNNMIELLDDYREYGGLSINWQVFGTSNIDKLEKDQLIIEHLIWKAPSSRSMNKHCKVIVQPSTVKRFDNPHYCIFKEGYFAVNSDKVSVDHLQGMQPVIIDKVRIHHYTFGDHNWYLTHKLARRKRWGYHVQDRYINKFLASFNQEKDETMLRFVPLLIPKELEESGI